MQSIHQSNITKRVVEFMRAELPPERYGVLTPQGGAWGQNARSPFRSEAGLFVRAKGWGDYVKQPDVLVRDEQRRSVPIIAEVYTNTINPTIVVGAIDIINLARSHYPSYSRDRYAVNNAILFVVLASRSFGDARSQKTTQISNIFQAHALPPGSLADFVIITAASETEAVERFIEAFRERAVLK